MSIWASFFSREITKGREAATASRLPWLIMLFSGAALVAHARVGAQSAYPAKPVRWVVPYAAGGLTERIARVVGHSLSEMWGRQVVVDMRPGANSIIGTDLVAKATPDGYTMLMALPALAINPSVYKKLPYDALRDLAPVTLVASAAYLFLAYPGLPAKSVAEVAKPRTCFVGLVLRNRVGHGDNLEREASWRRLWIGAHLEHVLG